VLVNDASLLAATQDAEHYRNDAYWNQDDRQ